MSPKFLLLISGCLALFFVVCSIVPTSVASKSATASTPSVEQTEWDYARLITDGESVSWHAGEMNVEPQIFTLETQYRRLGGRSRPNLVNLLNQIGSDGWELIVTDEVYWTFKRQQ